MMKCNVMAECQGDRLLVLNVDLRVAPADRVAELKRVLAPLKEGVGLRHLSFNLAYAEQGATKYCNLAACVTEDAAKRVVRVDFPADFYVSLWDGTAEKTICGLEYHVDKRTEAVTEVAVDPAVPQPVPGRNRLVVKLEDMDADYGLNSDAILNSLTEQVKCVRNWNLPVDFVLVDNFQRESVLDLVEIKRMFQSNKISIDIIGKRPEILESKLAGDLVALMISVTDGTRINIDCEEQMAKDSNLIFLYENNDGILAGSDGSGIPYYKDGWNRFATQLSWGRHPAVYLCSPTSERYCPVSYKFDFSADKTTITGGVMEISYHKEVNGQMELWIERRTFTGAPFYGASYTGGNPGPDIMKVQLGAITR